MNRFIFIGLFCLPVLVLHFETGECKPATVSRSYYQVPTLPPLSDRTTKRTLKCVCDNEDQPVCASNGVSYPSTCRFQCAKQKVPRLRVVSQGSCRSSLTKENYWNSRKSSRRL